MRSHALASAALLLLLLLHTTSSSTQGLTLDLYANGALGGAPFSSAVIASLDNVSLPGGDHAEPFSAEITGTVTLLRNESYTFSCQASEAITMLLLHVGDHLVCQRGADGAGAGASASSPSAAASVATRGARSAPRATWELSIEVAPRVVATNAASATPRTSATAEATRAADTPRDDFAGRRSSGAFSWRDDIVRGATSPFAARVRTRIRRDRAA